MIEPKERYCVICGTAFRTHNQKKVTCKPLCYSRWRYASGQSSTEAHYASISGNWERYFGKLLGVKNRRETLTVGYLMGLFEKQGGKCALSGQTMTCTLVRGTRAWTNASIDRIDNDRGYETDNVQLVCAAVNGFRGKLSVQEFVEWCRMVSDNQKGEEDGRKG